MEPEDIPVHDLLGVGSEPAPGPDELRAIVSRAGRKRWGTAAVAATLALGLGLGVGFATSGHSSPATQTATGNQASSSAGAPNPATGPSNSGSGSGSAFSSSGSTSSAITPEVAAPHLNKLFTRTTAGVTIRAFLLDFPKISGLPASCGVQGAHLQVEVSSASMVGIVGGDPTGVDRTQPASGIWSEVVGTAEGAPTAVVTAATGPGVTDVSMSFPGPETDQMAPVGGWVALVAPVSSAPNYGQTLGTLTERRANGKVVASQTVQLGVLPGAVKATPCVPVLPCVQPQTPSASGGGTSTNATTMPAKACAPLPCSPVPGVSSSPLTGQGTASASPPSVAMVKPGRPAIACALLPPAASGSSSGSTGNKP
jgi:hypothetical protein